MDDWATGFAYGLILMVYITTFFYLILSFISSLIIKKFFKAWNKHLINFISSISSSILVTLIYLPGVISYTLNFGKTRDPSEIFSYFVPSVKDLWLIIAPFVFLELIDKIKQSQGAKAKIGYSFLILTWVIISPVITLRLHMSGL